MGSRGLLYHAYLANMLAAAADANDPSLLPVETRRGEFGALLESRLERLLAARQAKADADAASRSRAAAAAASAVQTLHACMSEVVQSAEAVELAVLT